MHPTRVLLVDDEFEFTEVLSERMRNRGLTVEVAQNGLEALNKANESAFDAVILDLAMPGMDGIETLKRMLKQNPDLQVILLTGQATLQAGVDAMRSGAMEFMTKPAKIDDLLEKVAKAREKHERLTEDRIESTLNDIMSRKGW